MTDGRTDRQRYDKYYMQRVFHTTRGHFLKLHCPDSRVNIRAQFFAIRVIDVWNGLPPHIVTVDTVASSVKGTNSLGAPFLTARQHSLLCRALS